MALYFLKSASSSGLHRAHSGHRRDRLCITLDHLARLLFKNKLPTLDEDRASLNLPDYSSRFPVTAQSSLIGRAMDQKLRVWEYHSVVYYIVGSHTRSVYRSNRDRR